MPDERTATTGASLTSERLRPSLRWSFEILDTAPDAMIVVDQAGTMIRANRMAESVFQYDRQELLGATVELLVPTYLREVHVRHRKRYVQHPIGQTLSSSVKMLGRRKDGSEFPAEVALSPVMSESKLHVIARIRDVTDRPPADTSLSRADRMASLGMCVAGIAHELNGSIGAALLTAETALTTAQQGESQERLIACLKNIVSSIDRCGRVVQNVLKFSRNDPGMQVQCDLNETVWRVDDLLKSHANERGAIIQCVLCEEPLILANPLDLEMLVANLTRNAIESKEIGAKITISTAHSEGGVRLTVSDDGRGMSQSHARRVFEPFFTTRDGSGGTGLGMSIVHRITESHHASIGIDSELGVGTSVRVTFPRLNLEDGQGGAMATGLVD